MDTTIHLIAIRSAEAAYATASNLDNLVDESRSETIVLQPHKSSNQVELISEYRPGTIVLQPSGALDEVNAPIFQKDLEDALEQVTDAVIVDLLWVDSVSAAGIAALAAGVQRATALGKFLSFQSMDAATRAAVNLEWERQREAIFGSWASVFKQDLEHFLDRLHG